MTSLSRSLAAVILLDAYSNELAALLPLLGNLEQALAMLQPRAYVRVVA